jgi:RCC1 and BTB domain-containing protein
MFVSQITCGWSHSVGLTADGKVWTWGNGDHGRLGHDKSDLGNGLLMVEIPQMVEKLAPLRVVKAASYNEHMAALAESYDDSGVTEFVKLFCFCFSASSSNKNNR